MENFTTPHIIYGLFDPNTEELKYIGFTSDRKRRFSEHHYLKSLEKNTYKNNWIRSLLANGQKAIMLTLAACICDKELPQAEIDEIKFYKNLKFDLTNSTDGGETPNMTKEIKDKLSNFFKGKSSTRKKILTEEEILLIKNDLRGSRIIAKEYKISRDRVQEIRQENLSAEEWGNKLKKIKQFGLVNNVRGKKLTKDQILTIKNDPRGTKKIAKEYKISRQRIKKLKICKLPHNKTQLSATQILAIKNDLRAIKIISKEFHISRFRVKEIKLGLEDATCQQSVE